MTAVLAQVHEVRATDDDLDLLDRSGAQGSAHASELALIGLAGAAEQLEVVEAGEVAGELADVAAEDGRSTCSAP